MTERNGKSMDELAQQLQPIADDDAFITQLSQGVDPSRGTDDLAALLLELRDDVEKPMPPTPRVEGVDDPDATVIPMPQGRRNRPWLYGLIGAAAATVVLAGVGAALIPQVATDNHTVVELASKLDEIETKASEGDVEGARQLVDEAKSLVTDLQDKTPLVGGSTSSSTSSEPAPRVQPAPITVTATETRPAAPATPGAPAEPTAEVVTATEVATVTETVVNSTTVTHQVTVTVQAPVRENPLPAPNAEPQEAAEEPAASNPVNQLAPAQTQH